MAFAPIRLPGYPSAEGDGITRQLYFELLRDDLMSPEVRARAGGVTLGWPVWEASLLVGPLADDLARKWRGCLRQLKGAQGYVYVRDFLRAYPFSYPSGFAGLNRAGGGAFPSDGAASSWSVDSTRGLLTLNGLVANMDLRMDDQVGFRWTTGGEDRRALVAFSEDAAASSGGVAAGFRVDPPVPLVVPSGAVAYLEKPLALMRRVVQPGDSPALGAQDAIGMESFTVTFRQELLV
jgi:hypothetical protein